MWPFFRHPIKSTKWFLKGFRGVSTPWGGFSWIRPPAEPYTQEKCRGVEVRGRYFDWYGPTLHSFEDRPDVSVLPAVLAAIEAKGFSVIYIPGYQRAEFSDQRKYQLFETDRRSWRRPVTHDGAVVVVHDPTFNGFTVETSS